MDDFGAWGPLAPEPRPQRKIEGVRMFLFGFGGMLAAGVFWWGVQTYGDEVRDRWNTSVAAVKEAAVEVSDIPDKHWFKDRTIYYKVNSDGISLATNEEVGDWKAWQEDMDEAMEHNRQVLEEYYSD